MTKLDALVSITQTLLRARGIPSPGYRTIAAAVNEVERQLAIGADYDLQAEAVVELARRYGTLNRL